LKNDIYKIGDRFSRSNEFDSLRLFLACCVVNIHVAYLMKNPEYLNFGKIPALSIFVFLSGLLVSESYYYSISILHYTKKRLRRILPAYFTIVFLGGLTLYLINLFSLNRYETSLFALLKYYFFSSIFLDTLYPCIKKIPEGICSQTCAINGSLYTVRYELFFYSILPVIFFVGKKIKFFFPLLSVFSLGALSIYNNYISTDPRLILLLCFLSGVGISMSRGYWMNILKRIKIYSSIRFSLVILITILSGGYIPLFITLPLLTIICLCPTKDPDKDFNAIKFGDLSYGIYLIHWPLIKVLNPLLISSGIPKVFYPMIIIISSALGAIFLYWHIERKFLYRDNHYYIKS